MQDINQILIYPVFRHDFTSLEHPQGLYQYLGDALGRDCIVVKNIDGVIQMYKTDGRTNEDWYGWNADVLAPCDSVVEEVYLNPSVNTVGTSGNGRASSITFLTNDGTRICYAHVDDICVQQGESVKTGGIVAKVGNNGMSRIPHIHIGAWRDSQPLQIRFDLISMGILMEELGMQYFE